MGGSFHTVRFGDPGVGSQGRLVCEAAGRWHLPRSLGVQWTTALNHLTMTVALEMDGATVLPYVAC